MISMVEEFQTVTPEEEQDIHVKANMHTIYKSHFEAAHYVKDHAICGGKKHGHSYRLTVYLDGLNKEGTNSEIVRKQIDEHVQTRYDHNDLSNTSVEEIAAEICEYLALWVGSGRIELMETEIFGVEMKF